MLDWNRARHVLIYYYGWRGIVLNDTTAFLLWRVAGVVVKLVRWLGLDKKGGWGNYEEGILKKAWL
jgi:hypothetical protein